MLQLCSHTGFHAISRCRNAFSCRIPSEPYDRNAASTACYCSVIDTASTAYRCTKQHANQPEISLTGSKYAHTTASPSASHHRSLRTTSCATFFHTRTSHVGIDFHTFFPFWKLNIRYKHLGKKCFLPFKFNSSCALIAH